MAGALLGILGITVAGMAIAKGSFLVLHGLVMAADANSFVQQYRFAASDYVQDTIKSQAFSRVLSVVSRLASWPPAGHVQQRSLYPILFAGAFLSGAGLFIIGFGDDPSTSNSWTRKAHRKEGRTRREFIQIKLCYRLAMWDQ